MSITDEEMEFDPEDDFEEDACHHGIGFDEYCDDCEEEDDDEEGQAR